MKSIVRAMKPLMQILFLILFIIVIYAIIGLELLISRFHYTCFNIKTGKFDITVVILTWCLYLRLWFGGGVRLVTQF